MKLMPDNPPLAARAGRFAGSIMRIQQEAKERQAGRRHKGAQVH
jgi:hypothetical protein